MQADKSNVISCDIIIPVWNKAEVTGDCLSAIFRDKSFPFRVIVIDNGSGHETAGLIEKFAREHSGTFLLIRNQANEGFIRAVNQGLKASGAQYVCVLNNDTVPGKGWLKELTDFARRHPDIGLINPLCKGHIEKSVSVDEYAASLSVNRGQYMEMNQCQGFAMLIKREVIDKVGYLDERFGLGGFDDTDYSMRAHLAGYRAVCVYSAYVYHKEHESFSAMGDRKVLQLEAEKEYFKKWPRHLRAAIFASVGKDTKDSEIKNLLGISLALARSWCWMNVFFFGDKDVKTRVGKVMRDMELPLHQNIKFNYKKSFLKGLEVPVRVMERTFGTKARKKYDIIFCDKFNGLLFLEFFCKMTKSVFYKFKAGDLPMDEAKKALSYYRKD